MMGKAKSFETEAMTDIVAPVSIAIDEAVDKGYDLIFRVKPDGSLWDQFDIYYALEDMKIDDFRLFKDNADDARATTIYLLRNEEGDKGILVDADGIYGDARISTFIKNIHRMQQSIATMEQELRPRNKLVFAAVGLLLAASVITFKMISRKRK